MSPRQTSDLRPLDRFQFMEAWLGGYLAHRDGVLNNFDDLLKAVQASYDGSGSERARCVIEGED